MSSNRKLQGEIDRLLKKVGEGCLEFDGILGKVYSATSSNQKEKYEADLKKEIKKLQRSRDQIKTWIASNEVKQKTPLQDARKLIEAKMEQFKTCERDSKTKAFSKEGLSMEKGENDGKADIRNWIGRSLSLLKTQIDLFESEIETFPVRKRNTARVEHLQESVLRHKFHLNKLEKVLRNLENDTITVDSVLEIKDSIDHYVDNNQDPEFFEDEGVYDMLGLKDDDMLRSSLDSLDTSSSSEDEGIPEPHLSFIDTPGDENLSQTSTTSTGSTNSGSTTSNKSIPKKVDPQPARPSSLPGFAPSPTPPFQILTNNKPRDPVKQSDPAAVPRKAAASTSLSSSPVGSNSPAPAKSIMRPPATEGVPPTVPGAKQSLQPQRLEYNQFARNAAPSPVNPSQFPPLGSEPIKNPTPAEYYQKHTQHQIQQINLQHQQPPSQQPPVQPHSDTPTVKESDLDDIKNGETFNAFGIAEPGTLADLAFATQDKLQFTAQEKHHFSSAKPPLNDQDELSAVGMLETSMKNIPDSVDSERPKQYTARNPCTAPSYYPQAPASVFETPATFEKFDTDTLFFVFYYQQGSYQQYLAAKELKKQSWRYHKKYLTWFQRHEEPKEITNDYEQGTYVYFDYETGWCQRKKTEFTFEYRYLEDYD